jgi:hypothetical protein
MNKKGYRTESPIFFAAVMTHEGEFSGPLLQLIELMTMKGFKPHAERLKSELPDGDSTAFKTLSTEPTSKMPLRADRQKDFNLDQYF